MKTFKQYMQEVMTNVTFTYDWYKSLQVKWGGIAGYCTAAEGLMININPSMSPFIVNAGPHHAGSIQPLTLDENQKVWTIQSLIRGKSFNQAPFEPEDQTHSDAQLRARGFTHVINLGSTVANNGETDAIWSQMNRFGFYMPTHPTLDLYKTMVISGFNGTIIHEATHSIFTPFYATEMIHDILVGGLKAGYAGINFVADLETTMNGLSRNMGTKLLVMAGALFNVVEDIAMESWSAQEWPNLAPFIRSKNLILINPLSISRIMNLNETRNVSLDEYALSVMAAAKVEPKLVDVVTSDFIQALNVPMGKVAVVDGLMTILHKAKFPSVSKQQRIDIAVEAMMYLDQLRQTNPTSNVASLPAEAQRSFGELKQESANKALKASSTASGMVDDSGEDEVYSPGEAEGETYKVDTTNGDGGVMTVGIPSEGNNKSDGGRALDRMIYIVNQQGTASVDTEFPVFVEKIPQEPVNYSDEALTQLKTTFGRQLRQVSSRRSSWNNINDKQGKLVPHMLYRAGFDQMIFGLPSESPKRKTDYEFFILVDASGSMSHTTFSNPDYTWKTNFEAAYGVAYALWESLQQVYIPTHVYYHMSFGEGFYGVMTGEDPEIGMGEVATPAMRPHVVKNNFKLLMSIFDGTYYSRHKYKSSFNSNNMDGHAIQYLGKHVIAKSRSRRRKVLIVISDGAPHSNVYFGKAAVDHTAGEVQKLRDNGVIVKSLSITEDSEDDNNEIYGAEHNMVAGLDQLIVLARNIIGI